MGKTLAIHWAATTHGTWLHGDSRGSWLRGRLIGPDPFLHAQERAMLSTQAMVLGRQEQALVADAFGHALREWGYRVLAATIQPAHFHLIFAPLADPVRTVIARMKYRSSAAVLKHRRETGQPAPRSLWTGGMFPVFIFSPSHLANAIAYVRRHNRRVGLPDDPYDWISAPERLYGIPSRDDSAI